MTDVHWDLVQANLDLIKRIAKRTNASADEQGELLDALIHASTMYDESRGKFRAFAVCCMFNAIKNARVVITRRKAIVSKQPYVGRSIDDVTTDDTVIEQEEMQILYRLLERAPPIDRMVIVLRFWGDMTYEEIGEVLGVQKSGAHRAVRMALERLSCQLPHMS